MVGVPLNSHQWTQAKLPTKYGGIGLLAPRTEIGLEVVSLADLGFLVSHRRCASHIHEESAIQHLAACLPVLAPSFRDPQSQIDHRDVLGRIHQQVYSGLMNQHDLSGRVRLTAYSASLADTWLQTPPSWSQDTFLSNAVFHDILSMWLGVKILDDGLACSFCQPNLDSQGHHYMGVYEPRT